MGETTLMFQGKPMVADPINRSLQALAEALLRGRTVVAELEPGDATYYNLLIVPCWADGVRRHLGRYGVPIDAADRYLVVVKMSDVGGAAAWIPVTYGTVAAHDTEALSTNPWTCELLAWWLSQLISEMCR